MSANIHQVYIANPITTNVSTDLMYFGQSPYGIGNDAAMTFANFAAQFNKASEISVAFTPVNYVPTDSSVEGNLIGIDNALGDQTAQSLQESYDSGSDAIIDLSAGRPIIIQDSTTASSVNAVTTPSTGNNTVANWRVVGWTFTVASNRNVTALQYQDNRFSSGTRTVGIYLKSTGELLGSVDVAKTDPLDGSGIYRTHTLTIPIALQTSTNYVVAAVVPANETSNLNSDAVPGAGITITEYCSGASSATPIPLSFPTNYTVGANLTQAGFFEYAITTVIDSVEFPDSTTNSTLIFDINSTTRASHPFPSMTTAQRLAVVNPGIGDVVNDTDKGYFYRYNSSQWVQIVTNLPLAPSQSLSNSGGFPNISLGNPPRYYYILNFTVNGILSLPNAASVNAVRPGFPIFLKNPSAFVVTVGDADGNDLFTMNPGEFYMIQLDDNSTTAGVWVWTNLSVGTLQTDYDNGDGTITVLNDNSKPFAVGNDETNMFGSYGVYVSAIRNLEATPTEYWFQFFEAHDNAAGMVQYGAIACKATDTTAGSVSGFTALGTARGATSGEVLPFLFADGLNSQSGSAYPFLISDNVATVDPSSMLDVLDSTHTKGTRPYPSVTLAQRNAIASPATALQVYNSDWNTIDYYDGSAWQTALSIDKLLAGTNITLTQNGDGTVTIDATGSSPGSSSYYAGWAFQNGGTSTTFGAANTYVPINIAVSLNDILSSSFVNEVVSISGNDTPCFRYTGSTTQYFEFNFNLFVRGAVAAQKIYQFQVSIQRADTSIVQTGFVSGNINLQDLIFPYDVSLSGIVQLNTGDRVYISVQNKTDTSSVVVQAGNADILNVDASEQIGMVWNTVTTTSENLSPNNGYTANNGSLVTLTLPLVCNVGSLIQINGYGAGGFQVAQNTGQQCIYESASTTTGVTGTISSTNSRACLSLRCIVQDTVFQIENTTGSITLA